MISLWLIIGKSGFTKSTGVHTSWSAASAMCTGSMWPHQRTVQVGLIACNDYILLECCIYSIIHKHFEDHPQLPRVLKIFHEVSLFLLRTCF
jgi:hypothetical protein